MNTFDNTDASRFADKSNASDEGERLQKVLANAGVASRRVCENLILAGRVSVNGQTVTELGTRVNPDTDEVAVDGKAVHLDSTKRYVLLNKPAGVVSTLSDEEGRPDLQPYVVGLDERLYNVGRLDAETTGLLLLTNDGDLAHVLSHPSYEIRKTYLAKVQGNISGRDLKQLLDGIELEDGFIRVDEARILPQKNRNISIVELTLHSGRNRIVRRMLKEIGYPVMELARLSFGPLWLGSLPIGQTRNLREPELVELLTQVRKAKKLKAKREGPVTLGSRQNPEPQSKPSRTDRPSMPYNPPKLKPNLRGNLAPKNGGQRRRSHNG
ncbi:MAG: pseudouridine synthase [Microbacteriaceae bacterium]